MKNGNERVYIVFVYMNGVDTVQIMQQMRRLQCVENVMKFIEKKIKHKFGT